MSKNYTKKYNNPISAHAGGEIVASILYVPCVRSCRKYTKVLNIGKIYFGLYRIHQEVHQINRPEYRQNLFG